MTDSAPFSKPPLVQAAKSSWRGFLEEVEPLRPELYRYCRYLTRSPWDAEDLVQDALARAFVTLACLEQAIEHPRAWLFRVAYHLWLNRVRGARELPEAAPEPASETASFADARETREALGTLLALSPQERAAVVLKDVFDFKNEEIAETLSTTLGAVKSALHRGRGKLLETELDTGSGPAPALLHAFVDAFNARDLDRLTALLLADATLDFPGLHVEYGAETARQRSLRGVLFGNPASDHGGIPPALRAGVLPQPPRLELRMHRDEPLLLAWFSHEDGDAVRAIARVELAGELVATLRTYLHQPDVITEICGELGVPCRVNGYRFWW